MLSLENFEVSVSDKIRQRGWSYFHHGAVTDLRQIGDGYWHAVVFGSAEYEVSIQLDGISINTMHCDCPYDYGPVCKHTTAVLYGIRAASNAAPGPGSESNPHAPPNPLTLLERLTNQELRAFVKHLIEQDWEFKDRFVLYFADPDRSTDIRANYTKAVRKLIRTYSDRDFLDYNSTFKFAQAMYPLLQDGDHAVEQQQYAKAVAMSQAVASECIKLMAYSDDSAANISGLVNDAIDILQQVAEAPDMPEDKLTELYDWIERELRDAIWFDYGDFGQNLLRVAESTARRSGTNRFLQLLDQLMQPTGKGGYHTEYFNKVLIQLKIQFLTSIGREQEATAIINTHLDIAEIRQVLVDEAIVHEDYSKATKLIEGGIQIAKSQTRPGTVRQWEEELLRIAVARRDIPTIRSLNKRFAFERGFDLKHYQRWKNSYPPSEWPAVIKNQIKALNEAIDAKPRNYKWENTTHKRYRKLAPIFIQEEYWEALLNVIPPEPDLDILSDVHPHLADHYPEALLNFYLPALEKSGNQANNRKEYRNLATLMIKVKAAIINSRLAIEELAVRLLARNPRRPAMREELSVVLSKDL
jgi:hypothetical protein